MNTRRMPSSRWVVPLAALAIAGCLGRPSVDERWTSLEIVQSSVTAPDPVTLGGDPITVSANLTYRNILTGAFVAEMRASDTITNDMVQLDIEKQSIGTAKDVDFILANSVTAGRDVRTVTGFPSLVQDVNFTFDTFTPPGMGSVTGLFLVLYMGDEEEIEVQGQDSIVVTPWISDEYEVLHKGIAIPLAGPVVPPPPPTP